MKDNRKKYIRIIQTATMSVRLASASIVVALIAIGALCIGIETEASNHLPAKNNESALLFAGAKPTPEETPISNIPPQVPAIRIRIVFGEKQEVQVATGVDSIVLVSPEIATVEIKNRFTLAVSPLKLGETILLVTYGQRRETYIIQVLPRPAVSPRRDKGIDGSGAPKPATTSGSFTTMYSPQFGGGPSVLRQTLDYRQKLSTDKTLRFAGEMFKLFGNTDRNVAIARVTDFALNRFAVGLDTPTRSIDILDSQVNISSLSLNNYAVRGFHLTTRPRGGPKENLAAKGLEVFAGLARPSFDLFDTNGGKLAGVMIPVITNNNFQARAGFIAIAADRISREARGGGVFQADAAYAPTKEIFADAEMSYAHGQLSWRARVDLNYTKYGASGEVARFERSSPLNSIGAQYGGRKSKVVSFYWRPVRHVSTTFGYNNTNVLRLTNSQLADYDRSLLSSNVSFAVSRATRITLRYTDQKIETAFPRGPSKLAIETRTLSLGNTYRFNSQWSNTFEGRLNFNRVANADASLEKGFSLNEQLRLGWRGGSLTGFVRYNRKSPSLISLIVRNPSLLPPELQGAFAIDPAEFIRLNRDRIAFLLGGIELPETRNMDAGVRFQKTLSRFNMSGETHYNAGEIYADNQNYLYTSASIGFNFDNANTLQVYGWRTFAGRSRSGLTLSYTHRFGRPDDGFQFSKLFNFNRCHVRGRVFFDLNGNGQSDVGEPGLALMTIQIDGKRSVTTDKDGRYDLAADPGQHSVALISGDLGVRLLASTSTGRSFELGSRQRLELNFGVRDAGSIRGRVFNDVGASPGRAAKLAPGLGGVTVTLHSSDTDFRSLVLEQVTSATGGYDFSNLRPGRYLIEFDPATVPANYRLPGTTSSTIVVDSLRNTYYDMPIAAQRAVTGIVFIDKDGDGHYTYGKDEPLEGANVSFKENAVVTDKTGIYILRNLPAGSGNIVVIAAGGFTGTSFFVEIGPEPSTQRAFNLRIDRK